MSAIRDFRSDWRGFIARRLLALAFRVDPDCKVMVDAKRGWMFRRGWNQPVSVDAEVRAA